MLREFQKFINRGNVLDLAVAVIIGGAFGRITSTLVDQVLMPAIGMIVGGVDFSDLGIVLRDRHLYSTVADAVAAGVPVIQYGAFLNTIINFLLIAAIIYFVLVAPMNKMKEAAAKRKGIEAPATDNELLVEIRDLLAGRPLTHPSDPQA